MSSFIKRLRPAPGFPISQDDLDEIEYLLYLWVMGFYDQAEVYDEIVHYVKSNKAHTNLVCNSSLREWISTYRWSLFYNFDVLRLKLASLELLVHEVDTHKAAVQHFRQRGIPVDSADSYIEMLRDVHRWNKCKRSLRSKLSMVNVIEDMTFDPRTIRAQCAEDFHTHKVRAKCVRIAYKKLSFIATGNRFEVADLANDLIERCIGYYYRERPLKNRLHATNYTKSSIDGRHKQLIDYWTHPDRARVVKAEDYGEDGVWTNRERSFADTVTYDADGYSSVTAQSFWETAG